MTILFLAICLCLIALSTSDFRYFIVPYHLLFSLAMLCLFWSAHTNVLWLTILTRAACMMLAAIALRYGIYVFTKRLGCGWGDVWLFFICGLVLSIDQWPAFFLTTGGSGVIFGYTWKRVTGHNRFPFVPCISLGFTLALWLQLLEIK